MAEPLEPQLAARILLLGQFTDQLFELIVGGVHDKEADVEIAAGLVFSGDAFAAQAQFLSALRPGRHPQFDIALGGRNRDLSAFIGFTKR